MVQRIETLFRSPLARITTLIAVLFSFSCAVDTFEKFNKAPVGGETPFFCQTQSDCLEPDYRCDLQSNRCEPNVNIECVDTDGDRVFFGKDCLAAEEDRDCDDSDPAINPLARETCDGKDNDCDDRTDEGINPKPCPKNEGVCTEVETPPTYACEAGVQNSSQCERGCKASEFVTDGSCVYGPLYVQNEDGGQFLNHCDGKDNDCDGTIDEGCNPCTPNVACGGISCGADIPAANCFCQATGTTSCEGPNQDKSVCRTTGGDKVPDPFELDEIPGNEFDENCDGTLTD
jgi:hypothetical protein